MRDQQDGQQQRHFRGKAQAGQEVPRDHAGDHGRGGERHGHARRRDGALDAGDQVAAGARDFEADPVDDVQNVVHADAHADRGHRKRIDVDADPHE